MIKNIFNTTDFANNKNEQTDTKSKRKKAEYKSAIRSRRLIQDAYAALLIEKSVDKISVVDIVKRAGINRGTFYAHFATPYDVYKRISTDFLENIKEVVGDFNLLNFLENPHEKLHKVSVYLLENIETFRPLSGLNEAYSFVIEFKSTLVKIILDKTSLPQNIKQKDDLEIMINFLAGGLVMVYFDWVNGKTSKTIDQVETTLCKFISTCKSSFMELCSE